MINTHTLTPEQKRQPVKKTHPRRTPTPPPPTISNTFPPLRSIRPGATTHTHTHPRPILHTSHYTHTALSLAGTCAAPLTFGLVCFHCYCCSSVCAHKLSDVCIEAQLFHYDPPKSPTHTHYILCNESTKGVSEHSGCGGCRGCRGRTHLGVYVLIRY